MSLGAAVAHAGRGRAGYGSAADAPKLVAPPPPPPDPVAPPMLTRFAHLRPRSAAPWLVGPVVLAMACEAPTWADCDDAPCRALTVEAAYVADADRLLAELAAMPDQVEQAALVEQLAWGHPDDKERICGVAQVGSPAEARCQKIRMRPHLYTSRHQLSPGADASRTGAGPAAGVPAPVGIAAPWGRRLPNADKLVESCAGDMWCMQESGKVLAAQGDAAAALAACKATWPEGTAALHECAFRVAETLAANHHGAKVAEAMALCQAAGTFSHNCTQHILNELLPEPPPADLVDLAAVARLEETVAAVAAVVGPKAATEYADLMYAVWTRESFMAAEAVTGDLLQHLPPAAAPHVRMAAAHALDTHLGTVRGTVEDTVAMLRTRLAAKGKRGLKPGTSTPKQNRTVWVQQPASYWVADHSDYERSLDAAFCLGAGRRTLGASEDDDLRIVVMEAAARSKQSPGPEFFAVVALGTGSDAVRWTAGRLLGTLYPADALRLTSTLAAGPVADAVRLAVEDNAGAR